MNQAAAKQGFEKRTVIVANVMLFACLVSAICALVIFSIRTVSDNANHLDDKRSLETINTALAQTRKQIEGTTRDNAVWDDAVRAAYVDNDLPWMKDTWGAPTIDYPLYNDILLLGPKGEMMFGYEEGKPITVPLSEKYGPAFQTLVNSVALRTRVGTEVFTQSAFLQEDDRMVVVGIAPILPSSDAYKVDRSDARFLVLLKDFGPADIAELGESYAVGGVHLDAKFDPSELNVAINDPDGGVLGYISWKSNTPGTKSLNRVTPPLMVALALLLLFLALFGAFTRYLINGIHRDKLKAQFESTHDGLSGLLNRAGLLRRLDQSLFAASRTGIDNDPSKSISLVYLDLDGFKDVNDSYGHSVGDALIRHVAAKMKQIAPDDAFVARLGGDEFAILILSDMQSQLAKDCATAIHQLFAEPLQVDGRSIVVGASIGLTTTENDFVSSDELVRQADLAMYRAKDLGRGRTVAFEPEFDNYRSAQFALETDLGATIVDDGMDVVFQPLVDAKTSEWHGVEALARWYNKRLNQHITPDVFIPIAERSGLIEALGLQVLRKSLVAAQSWPKLKVSVNVSPAQFRNPEFPKQVATIIAETGFDARLLTLEITEGFFIRQPERALKVVHALKDMGIRISLDDFGSGYSSIGYLRQFKFDRLKIDRSLVTALDSEANAPSVILATVALANAFNIPVTAEGIEREEQASILRLSGCDEFQGFLFGKPMKASEIARHFNAEQGASAAQQVA